MKSYCSRFVVAESCITVPIGNFSSYSESQFPPQTFPNVATFFYLVLIIWLGIDNLESSFSRQKLPISPLFCQNLRNAVSFGTSTDSCQLVNILIIVLTFISIEMLWPLVTPKQLINRIYSNMWLCPTIFSYPKTVVFKFKSNC